MARSRPRVCRSRGIPSGLQCNQTRPVIVATATSASPCSSDRPPNQHTPSDTIAALPFRIPLGDDHCFAVVSRRSSAQKSHGGMVAWPVHDLARVSLRVYLLSYILWQQRNAASEPRRRHTRASHSKNVVCVHAWRNLWVRMERLHEVDNFTV